MVAAEKSHLSDECGSNIVSVSVAMSLVGRVLLGVSSNIQWEDDGNNLHSVTYMMLVNHTPIYVYVYRALYPYMQRLLCLFLVEEL